MYIIPHIVMSVMDIVPYVLLFSFLFIFIPVIVIAEMKRQEQEKQKAREEAQRKHEEAQRKHEEDQKMRQEIFKLVGEGREKLEELYSSRDSHLSSARQYMMLFILAEPSKPTYTRGVVEGSLADNIASLSNAQKRKEYNDTVAKNREMLTKFKEHRDAYKMDAISIISWLKRYENSEIYVAYEEAKYDEEVKKLAEAYKTGYY